MSLYFGLEIEVDTGGPSPHEVELFRRSITHNVSPMWKEAGAKQALYESSGAKAGDLLPALEAALASMRSYPDRYRAMNPPNGWGDYGGALDFLADVVANCRAHPKATVVEHP